MTKIDKNKKDSVSQLFCARQSGGHLSDVHPVASLFCQARKSIYMRWSANVMGVVALIVLTMLLAAALDVVTDFFDTGFNVLLLNLEMIREAELLHRIDREKLLKDG